MRYRKLDKNGDHVWGFGQSCFFIDNVEAVAQLISTRLQLWTNEWFLDLTDGTPFKERVLGRIPKDVADSAIRQRVLGTLGVTSIVSFESSVVNRLYSALMTVNTLFGEVQVAV